MINLKGGHGTQPETYKIIEPFKKFLKWKDPRYQLLNIHGNQFTAILPDKLLIHPEYKNKFIEFKVRKGNTISLSKKQKIYWLGKERTFKSVKSMPYILGGLDFWVLAAEDLRENLRESKTFDRRKCEKLYKKLFEKPNCEYLQSKLLYKYLW